MPIIVRPGFDPMQLGEQATVGLMLTAAVRLGHVGVLEYGTTKRHPAGDDGRYGRCEFWAVDIRDADYPEGWALEVKRSRLSPRHLVKPHRRRSATKRGTTRANFSRSKPRFGLLALIFFSDEAVDAKWPCERRLSREMQTADWSWKVSSEDQQLCPLYVLFDVRRRGRRRPAAQSDLKV